MKNNELTEDQVSRMVSDLQSEFCPFGWLDVKAAAIMGNEAGLNMSEVYEICEQFAEDTGTQIKDLDPVYCVYDHILQMARNEIDTLTGFDFLNDGAEIDTYGNFCCTSYDYHEDAKDKIIEVLAEHDIKIDELEDITQCFLDNIEISQKDIEAAKQTEES